MATAVSRYLCLSVDVQGYGRRDDVDQARIQRELLDLLDAAGARAGLDRTTWIRQPKGDEELALIPASEPPQLVVGRFCLELDQLLREHNRGRDAADRLRLRMAVDDGPVELSANGFAGGAVVGVSRLVNSAPPRQALAAVDEASLVVVVSQGVFRDWIRSGRSVIGRDRFRRVSVQEKEFVEDAWLWVPGVDGDESQPAPLGETMTATNLPPVGAYFAGRDSELARLEAVFDADDRAGRAVVCAISGMAGVGKTTLAVRMAHRLLARYPDGCFFVDLHGHSAQSAPVSAGDALDVLLRRLGVAGQQIPEATQDRSALLRERLRRRRVLLVLDNAVNPGQVGPLLPTEPGCAAIVTSRLRMAALDEAEHVELGVLSVSEGVDLFRTIVGLGRFAEPGDDALIEAIVARCGRLPLAVRIGAARLRTDPTLRLVDLYSRLNDEHSLLPELDDGERSVTASIAFSVQRLLPEHRRLFGLLSLHPAAGVELLAATALAGTPLAPARRLLDGLVDLHLLERPSESQYRFHDLVGAFARTHTADEVPAVEQSHALRRLVEYYLVAADRADRVLTPDRYRMMLAVESAPAALPAIASAEEAMAWLTRNDGALAGIFQVASDARLDAQCWQLAYAMRGYYFLTKRWDPWARSHEIALAAARRTGDRRAEAMTLNNLGMSAMERDGAAAAACFRSALALFEELDDGHGATAARANIAWQAYADGRYEDFVRDLRSAHAFYVRSGSQRNAAITLRGIALGEIELGRVEDAIAHLRQVKAVFERLHLDLDLVMTYNALGEACAKVGSDDEASAHHQDALAIGARRGGAYEMARAHHRLGELRAHQGDLAGARTHWLLAYETYHDLGVSQAADVAQLLGLP